MATIWETALGAAIGAGMTAAQKLGNRKTGGSTGGGGSSYQDFLSAADKAGLTGEFSREDLELAQRYPEFGTSILNLKQNYHNASTDEERRKINDAANALRGSFGNYTGGQYGNDYVSLGKLPGQIDSKLDEILGYGPYAPTAERPEYENPYAEQQQALLDAILNREDFAWSKETDPLYPAYRKEYLREGERATQNALAQAAAASGESPAAMR